MYCMSGATFLILISILNFSWEIQVKYDEPTSKRHNSKSHHRLDLPELVRDGADWVDRNILENSTDGAQQPTNGTTNNSTGPVFFPGEPAPDPPTTERVFLYNTTAPPVDNEIDARKKSGNVKPLAILKKKYEKHEDKIKKGDKDKKKKNKNGDK